MITTKVSEEIWADFDCVVSHEKKPDGAITVAEVMKRYGVSKTAAKDRMNKAVKAGWINGYYYDGRAKKRYIIKED